MEKEFLTQLEVLNAKINFVKEQSFKGMSYFIMYEERPVSSYPHHGPIVIGIRNFTLLLTDIWDT